jgi:hypothetical protein
MVSGVSLPLRLWRRDSPQLIGRGLAELESQSRPSRPADPFPFDVANEWLSLALYCTTRFDCLVPEIAILSSKPHLKTLRQELWWRLKLCEDLERD